MKKRYKWMFAIVFVVGILICIRSCMVKEESDLTVAYIGYDFVNRSAFEENIYAFTQGCEDITGDGKFNCDIMEISFNDELGTADKSNANQKLANAVGMGKARLYFISEDYVRRNTEAGVFADISSLGEGVKNKKGETIAISVHANKKLLSLGINPDKNMYLAIRIVSEMDTATDKNIQKKDDAAWIIAKNILS